MPDNEIKTEEKINIISEGQRPLLIELVVEGKETDHFGSANGVRLNINGTLIQINTKSIVESNQRGIMVELCIEIYTPELIELSKAENEAIRSSTTKH